MEKHLIQNTPEWLQMRKNCVGASDAPVIMGVSPYETAYGLWRKKLDLVPEKSQTWGMERGHNLEEQARLELEKMTGLLFRPQVKFHPDKSWMMASIDAIDVQETSIAEIKCLGAEDHTLALQGKIPDKYFPQVQHQLEVCQLEMGYYFSYDGEEGILIKIYRDDKYIKEMLKKELEFYECLQELMPPQLTNRDYLQREDPTWENTAFEWKLISQQIEQLEKKEKELRESLILQCQGQSSMGSGIKVMKGIRKGNVDYSKIVALSDIDLEMYRKPSSEFWKIIQQ